MASLDVIRDLARPSRAKILLLVLDGLGGLPFPGSGGATALEAAETPNLDSLAAAGICGLHAPVRSGITSGSGPAHLALFGYDPLEYRVGRGVLSALGIDFQLGENDVAARGNFCTVDGQGTVTDRRAGRISTERNEELCRLLGDIRLPGVEVFVRPVKEHRFLLVLRGEGLSAGVSDTDPQTTGVSPRDPSALRPGAERTAGLVRSFVGQAAELLADRRPANMVLLRGLARRPDWPGMDRIYGMRCAAAASYPMYRGLARLLGMDPLPTGPRISDRADVLAAAWSDYDFFFVHVKDTDSAGEDGDFDRKVAAIEEADRCLPDLLRQGPDVVVVTGDHSTPAALKEHSWHPVPVLLRAAGCRPDRVRSFGETACLQGGLGPVMPATDIMPLAAANAGRLKKFGA